MAIAIEQCLVKGRPKTFGEFLKREREGRGLSQLELARQVGLSSGGVIGNIESGLNLPRVDTLAALGSTFGWDFNDILRWFGAEIKLEGIDRLSSSLTARPALRRLVEAATALSNEQADMLAAAAEAWRSGAAQVA